MHLSNDGTIDFMVESKDINYRFYQRENYEGMEWMVTIFDPAY